MTSMTGQSGYSGSTGANVGNTSTGKWTGDKIPSGYKVKQMANYTPEQMQLQAQSEQRVGPNSYLSRLAAGDQGLFDEMEAPALKQFSGIQGGLASRFSQGGGGRGAMSSRRSSGFQNTMNQSGADFAQQLQSNRQALMRQATGDIHSMTQDLLGNRPYERWMEEKPQKQGWGGVIGAGVGAAGGFALGGPPGAMQGAQLGYGVGSAF